MADPIPALLDHVAVAVPDLDAAEVRWRTALGGGRVAAGSNGVFDNRQVRFANGAKLELLSPATADEENFVHRFLRRFGATVHHVTLTVDDLPTAIGVMEDAGIQLVDVSLGNPVWQEAFLRPSQVGGLVVQVASSTYSEDRWAEETGFRIEQPAADAAELLGPQLRHPDLRSAAALWSVLGAEVVGDEEVVVCRWPDSPLDVMISRGEPAGPVALRLRGTADIPAEEGVGPDVLGV
jgi:catechol 2,3-dioxygenase-like lactoylglutathione lyase family enzyme